ncbi:hypothetical protein K490DRAFT_67554 [Saccharata proteae CBS 121410]|uniref:Uncharacterized protein n=1 Tax=Saccharata proteae CBS 121410 TaxID=1314787 RepID=A0A9P4HRP2_9PEZI|nr:hypothetical protein K490DRAFT_67554 [Saccharata proteae CBS 121410]
MERLRTLVKDMEETGQTSTTPQSLAELEAAFLQGQREQALALWQKLADDNVPWPYSPKFLDLGIRMHARAGQNIRAHEILQEFIDSGKGWDAGLFWLVFDAHIVSGTKGSLQLAWALYSYMKSTLGTTITPDDFEKFYLGFAEAGNRQMALAVFKDMKEFDFSQLRRTTKQLLLDPDELLEATVSLAKLSKDAQEINETFLVGLTDLPRHQSRKLFEAWTRQLIALGRLDEAAQAVELMFERGLTPTANTLNTLISSWVRLPDANSHKKAEELGLAMVEQRLRIVRQASTNDAQPKQDASIPFFMRRNLPPAVPETFGLLLELYWSQGSNSKVNQTVATMREAQYDRNRRGLHVLMMQGLAHGDLRAVWKEFINFYQAGGYPTEVTWTLLWKACQLKYARMGSRDAQRMNVFPGPNYLMHQMLKWHAKTRRPERVINHIATRDRMSNLIMSLFCQANTSLAYILVPMHILYDRFGLYPTDKMVYLIVDKIARMGLPGRSRKQRRDAVEYDSYQRRTAQTLQALRRITELRRDELEGIPTYEWQMTVRLEGLTELIRRALMRWERAKYTGRGKIRNRLAKDNTSVDICRFVEYYIHTAKGQLGVKDLPTGTRCEQLILQK